MNGRALPNGAASSSATLDLALRAVFGMCSRAGPGARLQILMFHRVVAERDSLFPDEVDRCTFDAICGWLSRWLQVLPLGEAAERLRNGSLPSRAAAITFDDGYADNHDVALPVLKAHGLSATFFITTDYLDGGRMWNDTVIESVRRCSRDSLDLQLLGMRGIGQVDLASSAARRCAIDRILAAAKYLPARERLAVVEGIAERADAALPTNLMMTAAQVRALAAAGMEIGAHTASHPILATLEEGDARDEMARGRADLEAVTGSAVTVFAYPNGRPGRDYTARDVALVRELGFRAAVSTSPGAAGPRCLSPLQMPRFTPWDRGPVGFGTRLVRNLLTTPATV